MRGAVFGARGRTGKLVVEEPRRRGHEPVPVSRSGDRVAGVAGLRADAATGEGVAAAVEGSDSVVDAMASGKGNPVGSALARALPERDGLRYVTVGGAAEGDRKRLADKATSWLSRTIARDVVLDRQEELGVLKGSRLRWTFVRPPRLVDMAAKGTVKPSHEKPPSLQVTRADLARTVAEALSDDGLVGRAPFVSS